MKKTVDHSVTIIAVKKDNQLFGMTCAWSMQCGYNEMLALVGEQSVTGSKICTGDIIGVSVLSSKQKDIATLFGENHSNEVDKFLYVKYNVNSTAVLISDSKVQVLCKVKQILHLEGIEEDNLLYLEVLESVEQANEKFLHMSDF